MQHLHRPWKYYLAMPKKQNPSFSPLHRGSRCSYFNEKSSQNLHGKTSVSSQSRNKKSKPSQQPIEHNVGFRLIKKYICMNTHNRQIQTKINTGFTEISESYSELQALESRNKTYKRNSPNWNAGSERNESSPLFFNEQRVKSTDRLSKDEKRIAEDEFVPSNLRFCVRKIDLRVAVWETNTKLFFVVEWKFFVFRSLPPFIYRPTPPGTVSVCKL